MNNLLTRLTASVEPTAEIRALFNSKNGYIFVAAFKAFTDMGRKGAEFGHFLKWLVSGGSKTVINGKSWDMLDMSHSTRDSGVVHGKLNHMVALIGQERKRKMARNPVCKLACLCGLV